MTSYCSNVKPYNKTGLAVFHKEDSVPFQLQIFQRAIIRRMVSHFKLFSPLNTIYLHQQLNL